MVFICLLVSDGRRQCVFNLKPSAARRLDTPPPGPPKPKPKHTNPNTQTKTHRRHIPEAEERDGVGDGVGLELRRGDDHAEARLLEAAEGGARVLGVGGRGLPEEDGVGGGDVLCFLVFFLGGGGE